jgi:signal transduction histidine kinase
VCIVPRVIVIKGTDEGKQFELNGDALSVGREPGNRIRLHDTEVSRRHAEFTATKDGGYRLLDIGSANGTFVNGQSIRDVLLQAGDQIQIGQSVLVYSTGSTDTLTRSDLAERINLIARQQDVELSSAIVRTISDTEGSRMLARPESVDGPWLKNALANLGIMYEAIQAASHILDVNQLLERIMELIFRSLDADRGCIMLRSEAPEAGAAPAAVSPDQFEPKAVRWRDGVDHQEKMPVSRTIMEYVLREKQGILVSDATQDERFQAAQSIVHAGIREIICVPMKGRHETLGVLYLDTRTPMRDAVAALRPTGKFTEDHLALAIAIAHQAALAVEETHYHQALVQAERMAAIGQTIAALSHHIKNILQGFKSGGEILEMGLKDKDEKLLHRGWKILEKNQGKIYDLVTDMLSYSKEREPNLETISLNNIARDVVELMTERARELGVQLSLRLDDKIPLCLADPEGVHRSILNVVGNALDAVEGIEKPRVMVLTEREADGAWLRIRVIDNGSGIAPEKLADIFKPFVSTKGARGTGLGLAVSRKVLREHGGDIIVQSEPGRGSVFVLRLPFRGPQVKGANQTRQIPIPPLPN